MFLHIFAHIACLCESSGIHDGERHIQHSGQSLCHEGFAASGGAYEQDVGCVQLYGFLLVCDAGFLFLLVGDALVVVIDGHRQDALGVFLADYVVVEELVYLTGLGQIGGAFGGGAV